MKTLEHFVHNMHVYICMWVAYSSQVLSLPCRRVAIASGQKVQVVQGWMVLRIEVYGKRIVTLKRASGYGDITERRLEVAESEGTSAHRIVTLLQLSSWPLEEVPHPSAILSLVDLLSKAQRASSSRHTIVMCRYT